MAQVLCENEGPSSIHVWPRSVLESMERILRFPLFYLRFRGVLEEMEREDT